MAKVTCSFPANPVHRSYVLLLYLNEVERRAQWVIDSTQEYVVAYRKWEGSQFNPDLWETAIRKAQEVVSHAQALARMFDPTGAKGENFCRAQARVQMLLEEWPNVPQPPQRLRAIRNRFEHMEERMDEWIWKTTAGPGGPNMVDMVVGASDFGAGIPPGAHFRRLDEHHLYFGDLALSLAEVSSWAFLVSFEVGRLVRWPHLAYEPTPDGPEWSAGATTAEIAQWSSPDWPNRPAKNGPEVRVGPWTGKVLGYIPASRQLLLVSQVGGFYQLIAAPEDIRVKRG